MYQNDVWALDLSGTPTWSHIATLGTAPDSVVNAGAIFDPVRDRMVVFGGYDGHDPTGAAWALSGLLEGKTSTAALVTLMAAQHLAVLGRVHARMKWFVWLGQRVSLAKARAE